MSQQRMARLPVKPNRLVARKGIASSPSHPSQSKLPSPVLQLQRTLGNKRLAQLMRARRITPQGKIIGLQRQLTVGAADDQYEQEADHVARQVMSMPEPALAGIQRVTLPEEEKEETPRTTRLASSITRLSHGQTENIEQLEEEETPLQGLSEAHGKAVEGKTAPVAEKQPEKKPVQTRTTGSMAESFEAGTDVESRLNRSKGGGNPLPDFVRGYMEPRFGVDFSQVRVHTGSEAARMNRDVGAQAFTHGSDIYYGTGSDPGNLQLTAHELTHVVQQTGGAPLQKKLLNDQPNEAFSSRSNSSLQHACATCRPDMKEESAAGSHHSSIRRTIGDGHDLTSPRFSGDVVLEACFDNERLLKTGSTGEAVRKVQQALVDAGFPLPNFGVDGIFGSETKTAVRDFQDASSITIDGLVGPQTMGALDARFSGPTPPPPPPPPPPPAATITSETVATSPGVRTRTTIGVGEEVNLTHSGGSATWTTTGGTLSATTGATVTLTAPDTAQKVTVTANGATIDFTVIAPSGVHMDRFTGTGIRHTQNFPDSGIQTRPFLLPDTVNFSNVQYHEVDIGAVATGTYSCHNGTGHDASPATLTLSSTVVSGKGTQANARDTVYSGHCGGTAPFTPGSISFAIPYEYRIGTGSFRRFATVNQVHTLEADASTLNTDKAGAHGDTTVTAATSAF